MNTKSRKHAPAPLPPLDGPFAAIDFETADHGPDSACAVGVVRVEGMKIVARETVLIRPPRRHILFSFVHGITWEMVKDELPFRDAWSKVAPLLGGVNYLAAHNASFDRRVLTACCAAAELPMPPHPFICTVQVARRRWELKSAALPDVCRRLGIGLIHHNAGSDAEACARIIIAAAHPTTELQPATPERPEPSF